MGGGEEQKKRRKRAAAEEEQAEGSDVEDVPEKTKTSKKKAAESEIVEKRERSKKKKATEIDDDEQSEDVSEETKEEKSTKRKSKKSKIEKVEEETPAPKKSKKTKKEEKVSDNESDKSEVESEEEREPVKKTKKRSVKEEDQQQISSDTSFTAYLTGFPFDTDINEFVRSKTKGVIDVRVHTWHDTGRSRGCAHVDYDSRSALESALSKLDRVTVGTRYVSAVEANAKTGPSAPPPKEDGSRGGRRLFVKNLPYDITEQRMQDVFSKFGRVKSVRIPKWNHTDNKKGFGYVDFEQKAFAVLCVQTHRENPITIAGRALTLDYDQGTPKRGFKDEQGRAWYKPPIGSKVGKQGSKKHN